MFKKLHFKLTIYNTVILIVFMLIFSIIVYLFMSKIIFLRADRGLRNAAYRVDDLYQIPSKHFIRKDIKIDKDGSFEENVFEKFFMRINKKERYPFETNYILRDQNLNVTAYTVGDNSIFSTSLKYAKKVNENNLSHFVNLETSEGKIRLLTIPMEKNGQKGIVQVYTNINRETAFMSSLMTTLISLGLFSIIILATIGWLLAGKSLVPVQKSWQQQKDFVADASHELRTPLTVMQTNLEILLANQEEKISDNIKWLNNIQAETKMMSKLVNELLLLAKIDANQIDLQKKIFDLSKTVYDTIKEMETIFASKKIKLEKKVQENIKFLGDELRIKQLLHILLDNAFKYTPPGGNISFQLHAEHENIYIRVTDTGIGISDEDKERIFDRFYRVDKSRSRAQGETGLGLNIASWIVKEHNGKIEVQSKLGEGSSFIVVFPLAPLERE